MPKENPYLIKENYKKVEEVREIENKELITPEEQAKVVDKLTKNEIPTFEEFMKTYEEDERVVDSYCYEVDSYGDIRVIRPYGPGWGEWITKAVIVTGGSLILGPVPAIVVGGITAGAAKVGENLSDHPDDKKVFKFIGDCGGGIATSGVVGAAAEGAGALLGASGKVGLGSNVGNSAARKALSGECFTVDGMKLLYTSTERARMIAAATHGIKVGARIETVISTLTDIGFKYCEAKEHADHVKSGYDYKSWCKVCNA